MVLSSSLHTRFTKPILFDHVVTLNFCTLSGIRCLFSAHHFKDVENFFNRSQHLNVINSVVADRGTLILIK